MTTEQARVRLAEIRAMAKRGDYSWSFGEKLKLEAMIPEEVEAQKKFDAARAKKIAKRRSK